MNPHHQLPGHSNYPLQPPQSDVRPANANAMIANQWTQLLSEWPEAHRCPFLRATNCLLSNTRGANESQEIAQLLQDPRLGSFARNHPQVQFPFAHPIQQTPSFSQYYNQVMGGSMGQNLQAPICLPPPASIVCPPWMMMPPNPLEAQSWMNFAHSQQQLQHQAQLQPVPHFYMNHMQPSSHPDMNTASNKFADSQKAPGADAAKHMGRHQAVESSPSKEVHTPLVTGSTSSLTSSEHEGQFPPMTAWGMNTNKDSSLVKDITLSFSGRTSGKKIDELKTSEKTGKNTNSPVGKISPKLHTEAKDSKDTPPALSKEGTFPWKSTCNPFATPSLVPGSCSRRDSNSDNTTYSQGSVGALGIDCDSPDIPSNVTHPLRNHLIHSDEFGRQHKRNQDVVKLTEHEYYPQQLVDDDSPSKKLRPYTSAHSASDGHELTVISSTKDGYLNHLVQSPNPTFKKKRVRHTDDLLEGSTVIGSIEWTPELDSRLSRLVNIHGADSWDLVAQEMGFEVSPWQCCSRWSTALESPIHKGKWSEEEDRCLASAIRDIGDYAWRKVALRVPNRLDVQCRHRWVFWTGFVDRIIKKGLARLLDTNPYGMEKLATPMPWSNVWDGLPISIILPTSIICIKIKQQLYDKRRTLQKSADGPLLYDEQSPAKAYHILSSALTTHDIVEFTRELVYDSRRPRCGNEDRVFAMIRRWIEERSPIIPYGAHVQEKKGIVVPTNIYSRSGTVQLSTSQKMALNSVLN